MEGPKNKPGKNRKWGYTSYNVGEDREDYEGYEMTVGKGEDDAPLNEDEENLALTYTSFEKSGSVNRYSDNGDGGHSHEHWNDEDNFHHGEDPDWQRRDSGPRENPSDEDVDRMIKKDECYLTTACMHHYKHNFDDNCYELTTLRWFRDKYCPKELINHYYEIAPKVVAHINSKNNSNEFYEYMYRELVMKSIYAIENHQYEKALSIYAKHVYALERICIKSKKLDINTDEETKEI